MTLLFGNAQLSSTEYDYVVDMDKELVWTAAQAYVQMANEQMQDAWNLLVEPTPTTTIQEKYELPMTGRMQEVAEDGTGAPVSQTGSWDVAYELRNFHESKAISDVAFAYMTPEKLQAHIDGILNRARNAKRHQALYHLFNNSQKTFNDERKGSLTIEPLANGDSVLYPPVEGDDDEATEDHYLGSSYLASAISDVNNPYKTIRDDLVQHGMDQTDDLPIAFMINSAQTTVTEALTNFVPYVPPAIARGSNTDQVLMPTRNVPGRVIGYISGAGWVAEWAWVPAGYIVGVNMAAPQPYRMRIDPPRTGLGGGMVTLLPVERNGVITYDSYRMRFGLGGANRLSAAVMDLTNADSDYDIPTAYA